MMASDQIINVNELDFEYEVIAYSQNAPVLVDFWAEWCQPCKTLGPLLEKIVLETGGQLRLAKVNIDQNPNLAMRYNVRSIPTVKAFVEGQVTAEFAGVQPENRLRDFIAHLTPPSPMKLDIEKGQGLLGQHEWLQAESLFRKALVEQPESVSAQLGIAKSLLAQNKPEEAFEFIQSIPSGREFARAQLLLPYAQILTEFNKDLLPDDTPMEAILKNSLRLSSRGKFPMALDGLLDILREDKKFKGGLVKDIILAILELMGEEDPQTREYRSELTSVLF